MAREFDRSQISTVIPVNGTAPKTEPYRRLLAGGFADWRLTDRRHGRRAPAHSPRRPEGLPVPQPDHTSGVRGRLVVHRGMDWRAASYVLERVGIHRDARYVFFFTFDKWWDSIDMDDALHPQTLLAYAMNGPEMPLDHGAPLR